MLLLHKPRSSFGSPPPTLVAVFGVGLIGSAIVESLKSQASWQIERLPLSWNGTDAQAHQVTAISRRIVSLIGKMAESNLPTAEEFRPRLQVIWAAGRAGFNASAADVDPELFSYSLVAEMTSRVTQELPLMSATFHHISSAGGLFEGQRGVGRNSAPSIRREYGKLKQRQEELLANLDRRIVKRIYRLSSVIGPAFGLHRRGLISQLIDDGLHYRTTRLVGQATTLRDYIWHRDVGRYVAESVLSPDRASACCIHTLASAKPSSIHEVIKMIELVFGRSLYTQTQPLLSNDADITFSRNALPPDWQPTDLFTAVSRTYRDALTERAGCTTKEKW